jgi:hypothetical protein
MSTLLHNSLIITTAPHGVNTSKPNPYAHLTSHEERFVREAQVWANLEDAYRNCRPFDSASAEVSPCDLDENANNANPLMHRRFNRELGKRFIELIMLFCKTKGDCTAYIDKIPAKLSHPLVTFGFAEPALVVIMRK